MYMITSQKSSFQYLVGGSRHELWLNVLWKRRRRIGVANSITINESKTHPLILTFGPFFFLVVEYLMKKSGVARTEFSLLVRVHV
jgi:hypothetical protein